MWNRQSRKFVLFSLLFFAVHFADQTSCVAQSLSPQVWGQSRTDNPADPSIRFGVLRNGMMYAIKRNTTPPGQTIFRFMIKAGSEQEGKDQEGLAHFLEHMAFRGSTRLRDGEVKNILERLGLAFGPDTNATTSLQYTRYEFNLPTSDDASIDTGLMLLREIASELKIDPALAQIEKSVVLSEERARDTPGLHAAATQLSFFYAPHPFARLPIGQRNIIERASAKRMRDFYNAYYRPERAVLVVVGDVDPTIIEVKIKAKFADWQGKGIPGRDPRALLVGRRAPAARVFAAEGLGNELIILWPQQFKFVWDTVAEDRRRVVQTLEFMILSERLKQSLTDAGKPFSGFTRGPNRIPYVVDGAVLHLYDVKDWQLSVDVAVKTVRQIVQYGVTQEEVDLAVRQLRTLLEEAVVSSSSRSSVALAESLVSAAYNGNVGTSPEQDLKIFEQAVQSLTPEQINVALRKSFSGTGPLIFYQTSSAPKGGESAVLETLRAALSAPLAPIVATPVKVSWPYTDFGPAGSVVEQRSEDPGVVMVRFANGTRLTIKPTNFVKDEILVRIRFGHGLLDLPLDRVDSSSVATRTFMSGGLKGLTDLELNRLILDKFVGLNLTMFDSSFAFRGVTRPADLDMQMQLMTAMITAPAWRDLGFADSIKAINQSLSSSDLLPASVASTKGAELLRSGDPRWRVWTSADVIKWTFTDARAFFEPIITKSPFEVIVVGDVSAERAIAAVSKTIGALPLREGLPEPTDARKVKFPAPTPQPIELHHKGRADQGVAIIAWPTEGMDLARPHNRFVGVVLGEILKDRVLQLFRMQQGATYDVSGGAVFSSVYTDYGYLTLQVETPPDKMTIFFTESETLAADIVTNGVSEDELLRARTPLVDAAKRDLQSNAFWGDCLARVQTDSSVLSYCRGLVGNYENVTAAEIQAAAKKWLRSETAWRLIITPETKASPNDPR